MVIIYKTLEKTVKTERTPRPKQIFVFWYFKSHDRKREIQEQIQIKSCQIIERLPDIYFMQHNCFSASNTTITKLYKRSAPSLWMGEGDLYSEALFASVFCFIFSFSSLHVILFFVNKGLGGLPSQRCYIARRKINHLFDIKSLTGTRLVGISS